jgi:putative acetyltransferase
MTAIIRDEAPGDADAIRAIVTAAFKPMPFSSQTEAAIVDALRRSGDLTISLVAVEADEVIGHVAFSPVTIGGRAQGWFGLGPVAMRPDRQRQGIGSALIRDGLRRLEAQGAQGCVLLGDPGYYRRFGFRAYPGLYLANLPPEYFLALSFGAELPSGEVCYSPAFDAR